MKKKTDVPHFALYISNKTDRRDDNCPHCGARGRYVTYVMCSDGVIRGAMNGCIKGAFIVDELCDQMYNIQKALNKSPKWYTGKKMLAQLEAQVYEKAKRYNETYGITGLPERLNSPEPPKNPRTGNCTTGRQTITGTVQKIKAYGDESTGYYLKMIVLDNRDFAVFGTIPTNIKEDVKQGDIIEFNATINPATNDPTFGFYSRPLKAKILQSDCVGVTTNFEG